MRSEPVIAVVGADGFVGGGFADGLDAKRVVYSACRNGDIHVSQAKELLSKADVIINAGGFRVRRGLTYSDYQRCHAEANSVFIPWVRKDALFIHMSSAHVARKIETRAARELYPAKPKDVSFLSLRAGEARGGSGNREGGAGAWLRRGLATSDYPLRCSRATPVFPTICANGPRAEISCAFTHGMHGITLCHLDILVEVVRRVIAQNDLPNFSRLVVADPYTLTSRELERHDRQISAPAGQADSYSKSLIERPPSTVIPFQESEVRLTLLG